MDCREATYLISKQQEGSIGFFERIRLNLHLRACRFCKGFKEDLHRIRENIQLGLKSGEVQALSRERKEKIKQELGSLPQP